MKTGTSHHAALSGDRKTGRVSAGDDRVLRALPSPNSPLKAFRSLFLACAVIGSQAAPAMAFQDKDDSPIDLTVSGRASSAVGVDDDGDLRGDVDGEISIIGSTILESGLEIGAVVEGRYDEDQPGQLFSGGRQSGLLTGGPRGVGPLGGDAFVQGAYGYARGGFGKVIVGRDRGVARQLAVTAPTIFQSVNVNNFRTDLSGLNDIHTLNDFSGYATKVSYLPPANLFGGVIGGLQLGVSYSPKLGDCGEDLCSPQDERVLLPETSLLNESARWENVLEGAFFYQKGLDFGSDGTRDIVLGFGASVITADEETNAVLNVFEDYQAYSLGLNIAFRGLTLGGSVKTTNAGINVPNEDEDDYLAFDAGVTYKTGDWGFMLGYGQSASNVVGPSLNETTLVRDTQAAQAGVTYFLGRGITVGAAAQYIDSTKSDEIGGPEDSVTAVIEAGIKF